MSTSAGSRTIPSSSTRVASSSMGKKSRSVISSCSIARSPVRCLAMIASDGRVGLLASTACRTARTS